MKIKNIQNNIEFDQIFNFLSNRKNLQNKLITLNYQVQIIKQQIKNLQKDLKTTNIDIKKYKKFFKIYNFVEYDIFNEKQAIYHVNKIVIFKNKTEKFYDVYYSYIDLKGVQSYKNNICLRQYLHFLNNDKIKLQLNKKIN